MNHALETRRRLAAEIAPAYAANPNVAVVLLAGSVARGTADQFSDIEIDIFWHTPPSAAELLAPITQSGWSLLQQHVDEYEWADSFYVAGIKVDTSQFLVRTLDQWIDDVLVRADIEVEKQIRITAIQHGQVLYNPAQIERWRAQVAHYPAALQHAMLAEHLWFQPRAVLEMLAARDNALLLARSLVDGGAAHPQCAHGAQPAVPAASISQMAGLGNSAAQDCAARSCRAYPPAPTRRATRSSCPAARARRRNIYAG